MPSIDTSKLKVIERKPGWFGRYFDSPSMTFAHYEFKKGSTVHKHFHEQEEVWMVIEGELEITIAGKKKRAKPGTAGIVPSNIRTRSRVVGQIPSESIPAPLSGCIFI